VGRLKDNCIGEEKEANSAGFCISKSVLLLDFISKEGEVQKATIRDYGKWFDIMLSLTNKRTLYELANKTTYWEEKKNNNWQRYSIEPNSNLNIINSPNYRCHLSLFDSIRTRLTHHHRQHPIDEQKFIDQILEVLDRMFFKNDIYLPDPPSEQLGKEMSYYLCKKTIRENKRSELRALNLLFISELLYVICMSDNSSNIFLLKVMPLSHLLGAFLFLSLTLFFLSS